MQIALFVVRYLPFIWMALWVSVMLLNDWKLFQRKKYYRSLQQNIFELFWQKLWSSEHGAQQKPEHLIHYDWKRHNWVIHTENSRIKHTSCQYNGTGHASIGPTIDCLICIFIMGVTMLLTTAFISIYRPWYFERKCHRWYLAGHGYPIQIKSMIAQFPCQRI